MRCARFRFQFIGILLQIVYINFRQHIHCPTHSSAHNHLGICHTKIFHSMTGMTYITDNLTMCCVCWSFWFWWNSPNNVQNPLSSQMRWSHHCTHSYTHGIQWENGNLLFCHRKKWQQTQTKQWNSKTSSQQCPNDNVLALQSFTYRNITVLVRRWLFICSAYYRSPNECWIISTLKKEEEEENLVSVCWLTFRMDWKSNTKYVAKKQPNFGFW